MVIPVVDAAEPSLLFTRRTEDVRHHKGEISFPGGARHPEDADLLATALRETHEELGIPSDGFEVLGALPWMQTFVSGFVVVPFVARLPERPPLSPSEVEVAEVLEFGLARLASVERRVGREWQGELFDSYEYTIDGNTVWGVTGRILHTLLDILKLEGWRWRNG